MIIRSTPTDLFWAVKGDSLWKLAAPAFISIQSESVPGLLIYRLRPGYITDFRSGSSLINPVIPQVGSPAIALAWLVHDINYHGYLSRDVADQLLYDMLVEGGMSKIKAWVVYQSVRAFGGSHYSNLEDDQGCIYNANRDRYIRFEWRHR